MSEVCTRCGVRHQAIRGGRLVLVDPKTGLCKACESLGLKPVPASTK